MADLATGRRWIVEVSGRQVGMVVPEGSGLMFFAAAPEVWSMDRQIFDSVGDAERAARTLLRSGQREEAGYAV